MIAATQLRVGMTILCNGEPYRVVSVQHITPGNWRGMVQTKLKHLKTGSSVENRFRSDDKLEKAHLEQHEMEYLYNDGNDDHFMNSGTYEQVALSAEVLGDNVYFLTPNGVQLQIVETAPFMRGATAASSAKPATLETGLVVNVPAFIEAGELIRVDTAESKYLERAKA